MAGKARTHVLITLGVLFTVGGVVRILPDTLASAENTSPPAAAVEAAASPAQPAAQSTEAARGEQATPNVSTEPMAALPSEFCLTGEAAAALASDQSVLQARSADFQQREIDLRAR
ncbi:MAG TPA: hypothetical protein EYG02_15085, partial [Henriciella marina]|nr:hypothetical protein [Henriciella marina]